MEGKFFELLFYLTQVNIIYFYSIVKQNMGKSVAKKCVVCDDYFTAGVSVHFNSVAASIVFKH